MNKTKEFNRILPQTELINFIFPEMDDFETVLKDEAQNISLTTEWITFLGFENKTDVVNILKREEIDFNLSDDDIVIKISDLRELAMCTKRMRKYFLACLDLSKHYLEYVQHKLIQKIKQDPDEMKNDINSALETLAKI